MLNVTLLKNTYRDSVALMKISSNVLKMNGVTQASIVMASPMNIDLLRSAGLLNEEIDAAPSDILVAIEAEAQELLDEAHAFVQDALTSQSYDAHSPQKEKSYTTISEAVTKHAELNFVLISTPGEYAAAEAMKALKSGLHVMIFSDNVSLEEEITLKQYAYHKNLLVMGPDCGTAVINGIPLAFANVLQKGHVGIVAASGTGLQEVCTLLHDVGTGVSQAIGTGGRDVHEKVGGITMLQALDMLEKDQETEVILLVSKPPSQSVVEKIAARVATVSKPVIIAFIGTDMREKTQWCASTLKHAAILTSAVYAHKPIEEVEKCLIQPDLSAHIVPGTTQKYIRGLFSGGTYAYEALILLSDLSDVYSNLHYGNVQELENVWKSQKHTIIDMGDDSFTRGKPHPMIDYSFRNERILQEARDPETYIILLDVVLGYGSHSDPSSELVPILHESTLCAEKEGRTLVFFGRICATDQDPQNKKIQEQKLQEAGLIIFPSNADMILHAKKLLKEGGV